MRGLVAVVGVILLAVGVGWILADGGAIAGPEALRPEVSPDRAERTSESPAPPPGASRVELTREQLFQARMLGLHGDADVATLDRAYWSLRRDVDVGAMGVGQPQVAAGEGEPDDGRKYDPQVIVYRGPDSGGVLRVVVLDPTEFPDLYAKRRESLWLAARLVSLRGE
jgi:hypothetical protein